MDDIFKKFPDEGLIKVTDKPCKVLSSEQKAQLNRRGNILYNNGNIESARRIFQTTAYSDGLIRVAENYMQNGKIIDALKMFTLAHAEAQSDELMARAALAIKKILAEEESNE